MSVEKALISSYLICQIHVSYIFNINLSLLYFIQNESISFNRYTSSKANPLLLNLTNILINRSVYKLTRCYLTWKSAKMLTFSINGFSSTTLMYKLSWCYSWHSKNSLSFRYISYSLPGVVDENDDRLLYERNRGIVNYCYSYSWGLDWDWDWDCQCICKSLWSLLSFTLFVCLNIFVTCLIYD